MNLKLITFNCRGIQDYVKRRKLFHYLRFIESDIIFLQETHSSKTDELSWKQQWGEKAWFYSHTSNSRGVAILIRNHVSLVFNSLYTDTNGRYLIMSVSINDVLLILVIYMVQIMMTQISFWKFLVKWNNLITPPFYVLVIIMLFWGLWTIKGVGTPIQTSEQVIC